MPWLLRSLRVVVVFGALMGLVAPVPSLAEVGVGGQVGTLGVQGFVVAPLGKYFSARLGAGVLPSWSFKVDSGDINYDFDMHLYTLGAMLDWHPGGSGFRVSGGVILNNHEIKSTAKPYADATVDIGGVTYVGKDVGTLDAKAEFNTFAPYLGIGYNGAFRQNGNLFFTMEVGIMFWGSPNVTLTSNTSLDVPGLDDALRKQESDLEDQLDFLQYYPVAAIGITWTF